MARAIADHFGYAHLELDSVFHQPGWTPLPEDEFRSQVTGFVSGDHWVVDGNYTAQGVGDIVWDHADTVVWMDLPRSIVMRRIVGRSLHRATTGVELWNGNTENLRNLFRRNPEENIVMWTWTRFDDIRDKYAERAADPRWSHVDVVRLRTQQQADDFLASLKAG